MTARSNWFAGDAALARRVDGLCDRLEAAWRSGVRPELEQFLTDVPDCERPLVLRELLATELECRVRYGETPSADEYRARFPADPTVIAAAFATLDGKQALGETRTHLGGEAVGASTISDFGESGGDRPRAVAGLTSTRLGDYDIVRELGKGGMGIVYEARQRSADRLVALKLIRPERLEALSEGKRKEVIERFRTEAHAAARLDHEHLVTVFDVGQIEGRPYYSMRYVPGKSLAEILLAGPLPGTKGAAYLEPVARALQVAHAAGILHRDLKPHNILIDERTDRPLVADFGLAKLLEGGQDVTVTGEVFGSPPYMAPEQALDSAKASTASDVYGLGATLYHALAGRPPFQAASAAETLRQVIDVEPVPPRQLNPAIDRDLETICLKCLQKEQDRRYDSAGDLADDLKRFLDDRPILARRAGAVERTWRWSRRNPKIAVLAALLFLSLSAGLIGIGSQWRRAEANLTVANDERGKAEGNLALALEVVKKMLVTVSEEKLRDLPEMEPIRRELLTEAKTYYETFLARGASSPELRRQTADAHVLLGEIHRHLEEDSESEESFRKGLEQQRKLAAEFPHESVYRRDLVLTLSSFGTLRYRQGRLDESEEMFLEMRTIGLALVKSDEHEDRLSLIQSLNNLGVYYRDTGQFEKAADSYTEGLNQTEVLVLRAPDNDQYEVTLAKLLHNLGHIMQDLGRFDESERFYVRATLVQESLLLKEPNSVDYRQALAATKNNIAWLYSHSGRTEDSLEPMSAAIEILARLAKEHPSVPRIQFELARSQTTLAFSQTSAGKLEESQATLRQALETCESLNRLSPNVPEYESLLGRARGQFAWQLERAGKADEAEAAFHAALEIHERVAQRHPDNPDNLEILGQALHDLGMHYRERDPARARTEYEKARAIRRDLSERFPKNPQHLDDLAWTVNNLGVVLNALDQRELAADFYRESIAIRERLFEGWPENAEFATRLGNQLALGAQLAYDQGAAAEYVQWRRRAVEVRELAVAANPGNAALAARLAVSLGNLANAQFDAGEWDEAVAARNQAVEILLAQDHTAENGKWLKDQQATMLAGRGMEFSLHLARHGEALADLDKAIELSPRLHDGVFEVARAQVLARLGRIEQALDAIDRLGRLPESVNVFHRTAELYAQCGDAAMSDASLSPVGRVARRVRYDALAGVRLRMTANLDRTAALDSLASPDMAGWLSRNLGAESIYLSQPMPIDLR